MPNISRMSSGGSNRAGAGASLFSNAGALRQGDRALDSQQWQNFIEFRLAKDQLAAQKHATTKSAELGWAGLGTNILGSTFGMGGVGTNAVGAMLMQNLYQDPFANLAKVQSPIDWDTMSPGDFGPGQAKMVQTGAPIAEGVEWFQGKLPNGGPLGGRQMSDADRIALMDALTQRMR